MEIPADFRPSSYLDIGTGSGITALECIKKLVPTAEEFLVDLLDGLQEMLDRAYAKVRSYNEKMSVKVHHGNAFGDFDAYRSRFNGGHPTDLITTKRVLLNH